MLRRAIICLALVAAASVAQTVVSGCTAFERFNLNPATGFPYCIVVGVLRPNTDNTTEPFSHTIPQTVWNRTVEAGLFPGLRIAYNFTDLFYDDGLDGLRNGDYDVYLADMWSLTRRAVGIDWSMPYTREFIGLVYTTDPEPSPSMTGFFKPLSTTVWLLAAVLMFVGALLLFLVEWLHPTSAEVPKPGGRLVYRFAVFRSLMRCFDSAFMSPFGSGRFNPSSTAGAVVVFGLKFFFLIFFSSYTANLASALTVAGASSRITLDSLLKQSILTAPNANADFAQAVGGKLVFPDPLNATITPTMLRELKEDGNSSIGSHVNGQTFIIAMADGAYPECDTRYLRLPFLVDTCISFREANETVAVRRILDTTILRLRQNGTMVQLYNDAYDLNDQLRGTPRCQNSRFASSELPNDPTDRQLTIQQMQGIFIISACLFGVAILVAGVLRAYAHVQYPEVEAGEDKWGQVKELLPFLK